MIFSAPKQQTAVDCTYPSSLSIFLISVSTTFCFSPFLSLSVSSSSHWFHCMASACRLLSIENLLHKHALSSVFFFGVLSFNLSFVLMHLFTLLCLCYMFSVWYMYYFESFKMCTCFIYLLNWLCVISESIAVYKRGGSNNRFT